MPAQNDNVLVTLKNAVNDTDTLFVCNEAVNPYVRPGVPTYGVNCLVVVDDAVTPTVAEVIEYSRRTVNSAGEVRLHDVTRGAQNTTAHSWSSGAVIAGDFSLIPLDDINPSPVTDPDLFFSLDQATDVDYPSAPSVDDVLRFDGTNFVPSTVPGAGALELDDLTDVDTTTSAPVLDDYLKYDGFNFVPAPMVMMSLSIDDLTDVDTTTLPPNINAYLRWNGANFVPTNFPFIPTNLDGLTDVDTTTVAPTTDDILKYDGANFVPFAFPSIPGGLDDLSDVDVTTVAPSTNDYLRYNGSNFVPTAFPSIPNNLDDLGDVDTTTSSPSTNDYLRWDGSNFVPTAFPATAASLDELTDVDVTTVAPTTDDILKFDGANFVPFAFPSIPVNLDDLGDVDTTTVAPSTNDYLRYNGVNFVPTAFPSVPVNLDDLGDVDTTTVAPSTNDYLRFDGSDFVPTAFPSVPSGLDDLSDVDTTTVAPSTNDYLRFDGSNFVPTGFPTIPTNLDGLADVDTTTVAPSTNDYLRYDGANFVPTGFPAVPVNLDDLGDVDTTTVAPSTNDYLRYDGGDFVPTAFPSIPANLDDLGDVDTTTVAPSTNDYLRYDGSNFVPTAFPSIPTGLDDLSDVDTTTAAPSTNDVLQFDGSDFVPVSLAFATTLDGLSDVDVSTVAPVTNDLLKYNGSQFVPSPEFPHETLMPRENGFIDASQTEISFVNGTRTFTLSLAGGESETVYYSGVQKFTMTASKNHVIADTEGLHFIYLDGATLTSSMVWDTTLIEDYAMVAVIYWNQVDTEAVKILDQRHGATMDAATHLWTHFALGATWRSGLTPIPADINGNGDNDPPAQLSITDGSIQDADLVHTIVNGEKNMVLTPIAQLPIWYRTGAAGVWRELPATNFPMHVNAPGERAVYNEWTGSTWQTTEVTNTDFFLVHLAATPAIDKPLVVIMGQNQYGSKSAASDGALTEVFNLATGTMAPLLPEIKFIATLLGKTQNGWTNAVKSSFQTFSDGSEFIDWRFSKVLGNISSTAPLVAKSLTLNAGEALSAGDIIAIKDDGGERKVYLADATDDTLVPMGFVVVNVSAGNPAPYFFPGEQNNQVSGMTQAIQYLDPLNPGKLTQTKPTTNMVWQVGYSIDADSLIFQPHLLEDLS